MKTPGLIPIRTPRTSREAFKIMGFFGVVGAILWIAENWD